MNVIAQYLRWMEAGSVSPQTLRLRENHLGRFARSHDLLAATSDDIVGYLRRQEWKPATAASFRSSLSSFYKWALDEGLVDENPLKSVRNVRVPPAAPKIATAAALDEALAKASRRDRLAVMLAAYAGLRRGEIAGIHSRDVDDDWLRITGKGGRTRRVPIHPEIREEVLRARAIGGYFFPDRSGDGSVTPDAMGRRIARLLPDGLTAHSLRHMFATRTYNHSHDLRAVQTLLGHSSLATTQIYLHSDEEQLKSAVFGT
ncbi:MAG TPA: tyrosine-type recombinase/integrase [Acidimicrobiia bacterium]